MNEAKVIEPCPFELPVAYAGGADAHIYNRDGIVADMYEIATGLGVDDSGIGTKEYDEFRDSAGKYIAKCINEHAAAMSEVARLRTALEHYANGEHWYCNVMHIHDIDSPECLASTYNQTGNGYDVAEAALNPQGGERDEKLD